MSNSYKIEIGTFTLTEKRIVRKSYECAAWFTDVEVQPGTYPVFAYVSWTFDGGGMYRLHSMSAQCDGVIVDNCQVALWAGNRIGNNPGPDHRGEQDVAHIELPVYGAVGRDHKLAKMVSFDETKSPLVYEEYASEYSPSGKGWHFTIPKGVLIDWVDDSETARYSHTKRATFRIEPTTIQSW